MNTMQDNIEDAIDQNVNNIGGKDYDATSTYDVGDIVKYQGQLYICTTAITTAEAWNSNHWQATDVLSSAGGNEIAIGSQSDITGKTKIFVEESTQRLKYKDSTTGQFEDIAGDEVFIGDEEDAPDSTKLLVDTEDDSWNNIETEVVDTLSGNEANRAPSVRAVNEALDNIETEVTNARQSTIKDKTFASVDARIEELEEDVDKIEAVRGHIYGVRRKITNNTSTVWERIKDSVGLIANATKNGEIVVNNFDELAPWSEIKSCNYNLNTGKITAWYGDATFKFDGSNGDVFTYIPDVYLKIYQEDDYDYILLSDIPRSGFTKYDSFFIARYTGSVVSDKLHSYSGLTPTVSKTIAQFRTLARALGNKFSLLDYRYFIIQMLYLVEYANYNCQSMLGNGVMSRAWTRQWNGLDAGGCDSLGMKSGCLVNDGKNSVIYRGIENPYGNMWQPVDGITVVDRVAYICKDHSQYADSKTTSPYKQLGYVNGDTNGYTKNLGFDPDEPLARFPVEVGGSNASGTGDYYYQNAGTGLARVGGNFSAGTEGGFWCWVLNSSFSYSNVDIGCRVLIDNQ